MSGNSKKNFEWVPVSGLVPATRFCVFIHFIASSAYENIEYKNLRVSIYFHIIIVIYLPIYRGGGPGGPGPLEFETYRVKISKI